VGATKEWLPLQIKGQNSLRKNEKYPTVEVLQLTIRVRSSLVQQAFFGATFVLFSLLVFFVVFLLLKKPSITLPSNDLIITQTVRIADHLSLCLHGHDP
jgi:hypothetical protein